ncbi:hypothetical protein AB1Y20_013307 [Prymnesium parvum]|uniref:COX assembly mitochondrial protein n=1 Tax=Prymnesium parvum TaxID=97485 RepID=A0AB34IK82_PRYPA
MPDLKACAPAQQQLFECKRKLGLLPNQCYPSKGYQGQCDEAEFELKKCIAFDLDAKSAAVLYNPKARREDRVNANARLQHRLRPFNQPCTP